MTLPTLESAIEASIDGRMKEVHTSMPGKINSFDPATQLCEVELGIQRVFSNDRIVNFPPLINVPVCIMRGGGFSNTFPIKAGNECLVLFSERSIDRWVASGQNNPPIDKRNHDLSDAVAIVGLSSQPNKVPSYDNNNYQLKSDDGKVSVTMRPDGTFTIISNDAKIDINAAKDITVGNSGSQLILYESGKIDMKTLTGVYAGQSLFSILNDLADALSTDGVGALPLNNRATYVAIKARFDAFIP